MMSVLCFKLSNKLSLNTTYLSVQAAMLSPSFHCVEPPAPLLPGPLPVHRPGPTAFSVILTTFDWNSIFSFKFPVSYFWQGNQNLLGFFCTKNMQLSLCIFSQHIVYFVSNILCGRKKHLSKAFFYPSGQRICLSVWSRANLVVNTFSSSRDQAG